MDTEAYQRLLGLTRRLRGVSHDNWSAIESWCAWALPIILHDWPQYLDDFRTVIAEPRWDEAQGEHANRLKVGHAHGRIRAFLEGLQTAEKAESGAKAPSSKTSVAVAAPLSATLDTVLTGTSGSNQWFPPAIADSLATFRLDHPDPAKVAFVMMRFGTTRAHTTITETIRSTLQPLGITALRADDKEYHQDLFPNVLTCVFGCGFGIAVFECLEHEQHNPNVALEVGYMYALRKPVCLLKDKTLRDMPADIIGRLYRPFDAQNPSGTIPETLSKWLKDQGLGRNA